MSLNLYTAPQNKHAIDLLKRLDHIPSASFESTDSDIQTRVECTPGTRTQVLDILIEWSLDPAGTPFFWLNGMAGTGKSTIAQSICNRLDADGRLAASFFCSRSAGGGRNNARNIVPTIVFQLAYHVQGFMRELCDVLRMPDRTTQSIAKQLQQLLWRPLSSAFETPGVSRSGELPPIIVIDGLDECLDTGAQQFVQSLLRRFEHDHPVHLRFLLLSRSERHIGIPIDASTVNVSRLQLHSLQHSDVSRDIRRYVESGFYEMSSRRDWGIEWYTEDDIECIVIQANVLFIYAATVLKYLEESRFRPEKRLDILRQMGLTATTKKTGALRPLHLLYSIILQNLGKTDDLEAFEVDLVRNILFIISSSPTPLSIPVISDLLQSEVAEVKACIGSLSSVVLVPPEPEEKAQPVKVLHASFPEFVRSSSPLVPEHFRFDVGNVHRIFLLKCLAVMNEKLREGILGSSANQWTQITAVSPEIISTFISPGLQYAAQHWLFHALEADLRESVSVDTVSEPMSTFVNTHLLHWLECLAWTDNLQSIQESLAKANLLQHVSDLSTHLFQRKYSFCVIQAVQFRESGTCQSSQ